MFAVMEVRPLGSDEGGTLTNEISTLIGKDSSIKVIYVYISLCVQGYSKSFYITESLILTPTL